MKQIKQFDTWMNNLGKAWMEKDMKLIADICTEKVEYYESPFTEPLIGRAAVKAQWEKDVPNSQKDIKFKYDILVDTDKVGVAHWYAEFTRVQTNEKVILDGIFYVELNEQGLCTKFRLWSVRK